MAISESDFQQLLRNVANGAETASGSINKPKTVAKRPKPPLPVSGPLEAHLVLWGHCPSKKNLWSTSSTGAVFIPDEVKEQIATLTTQALFAWKHPSFVEHPDLTVKFYVRDARRDRDGMFVTVLDCLQAAGVLKNDNCKWNNGRTILEPCEFVLETEERVEITVKVEGPKQ